MARPRPRTPTQSTRAILAGLVIGFALFLPRLTLAQGSAPASGLTGGDDQSQLLLDGETTVETAVSSFAVAARRLGESFESEGSGFAGVDSHVDQAIENFRRSVEQEIVELQGDGTLTLDEVTPALEDLRANALALLREQLSAEKRAVPPPPDPDESSWGEYALELTRYTVVVRNEPLAWVSLLAWIVAGILTAWGVNAIAKRVIRRIGKRLTGSERWGSSLRGPLYLSASVGGVAVGLSWIWLPATVESVVWVIVRLLFTIAALWLCWRLCDLVARGTHWLTTKTGTGMGSDAVDAVRKGLRLAVLVLFAMFTVEVLLDTDFKGLIAGLGILTIAVSLAAQDTLKNLIGSFTIYGDRPFRVGDLVDYRGYLGEIEDIGFRSTKLRTFDGHLVTIPNADVVKEPVENLSARPTIRARYSIDIPYDLEPERVEEAIERVREAIEPASEHGETYCELDEFGAYSLRLLVQYYLSSDYWTAKAQNTEIQLGIYRALGDAEIDFAFPTEKRVLAATSPGIIPSGSGEEASGGD